MHHHESISLAFHVDQLDTKDFPIEINQPFNHSIRLGYQLKSILFVFRVGEGSPHRPPGALEVWADAGFSYGGLGPLKICMLSIVIYCLWEP